MPSTIYNNKPDEKDKIELNNQALREKFEEFYKQKVALEMNIAIEKRYDANEVDKRFEVKKPKAFNNGTPISWEVISSTRGGMIKNWLDMLQRTDEVLETIESLFQKDE